MRITIDLTDQQAEQLQKVAEALGVDPGELARAACTDLLSQPSDEFQEAAQYVLKKNRELYERLS